MARYGMVIDTARCVGCMDCVVACKTENGVPEGYADKCTMCIHRVEAGSDPSCVAVCPTHCMYFGDMDDPNSSVSRLLQSRRHHALLTDAGTRPQLFYLE